MQNSLWQKKTEFCRVATRPLLNRAVGYLSFYTTNKIKQPSLLRGITQSAHSLSKLGLFGNWPQVVRIKASWHVCHAGWYNLRLNSHCLPWQETGNLGEEKCVLLLKWWFVVQTFHFLVRSNTVLWVKNSNSFLNQNGCFP